MKRRFIFAFFSVLVLIFLALACSRSYLNDQLKFGVWAAENELWDEAIFRWKKTLLTSPNSVAAHNNLAVAYEKKGLWEEAKKEYELALKLAPENSHIKSNYQNFKENLELLNKEKDEKK